MIPPEAAKLFFSLKHIKGLTLKEFNNNYKSPVEFLFDFLHHDQDVRLSYRFETVQMDGLILTRARKIRSLQETFDIVSSYFPNYTFERYIQDIYTVSEKYKAQNYTILIGFCGDIKRVTINSFHLSVLQGYLKSYIIHNDTYFYNRLIDPYHVYYQKFIDVLLANQSPQQNNNK